MPSKRKHITIREVAKETGVSISTVSNVLNKSRYVKKETEERILEAVKKLNYRPNMVARGLRLKSTGSVGVIVPDISNPFFAEMVRGMENVARELGYTLILCCTYYDTQEEERQLNLLRDKWVDGFIFASGYNTDDHIAELVEQKIAVVAVDREITDFWVPSVLIDNVEAAKKAVDYLCQLGHKRIAYISFPSTNMKTVENRYLGYREGLRANNIPYDPSLVLIAESLRMNEIKESYSVLADFLQLSEPPTAIFVMADLMAIGILRAVKEMGLRVPEDISIMGFDNIAISAFTDPPLTTIKQPKKKMGATAMQLLIDLIRHKRVEKKKILMPTEVVVRQSTGKVATTVRIPMFRK